MMMSLALLLYYTFILHQTTTMKIGEFIDGVLYYTFILHQTTTTPIACFARCRLYYTFILHQTTTYTTYITDVQPFENHIGRYEVV